MSQTTQQIDPSANMHILIYMIHMSLFEIKALKRIQKSRINKDDCTILARVSCLTDFISTPSRKKSFSPRPHGINPASASSTHTEPHREIAYRGSRRKLCRRPLARWFRNPLAESLVAPRLLPPRPSASRSRLDGDAQRAHHGLRRAAAPGNGGASLRGGCGRARGPGRDTAALFRRSST
jgi:hypothetical protein